MAKLLVTGATGQLGALVIESLLKWVEAKDLAVSVRDPKKAEHLSNLGIDVRQGDFTKPESLSAAFAGIDRLLLISSASGDRIAQHKAAIEAAKAAGVQFIAYTSVAKAQESGLFLAPDHRETENAIRESGITYAILRNNWYLENEASTVQSALQGAPWLTSAGSGKVGWAARRDYAEAAAKVLATDGHENVIYELSGKPLTQEELAALVQEASGKDIQVQQVNDETYTETLKGAGVPEAALPFLLLIQQGIRAGELDVESTDFERVLGRPLTPLKVALGQVINQG
ncbi:Quinone oxidoreductase 2 [compost metagenome]